MKKTLWKDIRKCFSRSKGRFISISCLVALGSFALVGLKAAGPDMRQTGRDYFEKLNTADISVIGDYGIDETNQKAIERADGADAIEYGYLKDVVIKDTLTSIRIFSATDSLSQYDVKEGRMPETADEIAIASFLSDDYKLGDSLAITEKEDSAGDTVLKKHSYKIVGYVNSGELLSAINMGQSTAGTGELLGYAVVTPAAFDSDVYMIARLSFSDLDGVDPYSDEYTNKVQAHKNELNTLLADQPELRLSAVKTEYQEEIDDGQQEVDDAKKELSDAEQKLKDARNELDDANSEVNDAQKELDEKVADAEEQISDGKSQLSDAQAQLENASAQLAEGAAAIQSGQSQLTEGKNQLAEKSSELTTANEKISAAEKTLAEKKAQYSQKKKEYDTSCKQLTQKQAEYDTAKKTIDQKQKEYDAAASQLAVKQKDYDTAAEQLSQKQAQYDTSASALSEKKAGLQAAQEQITAARETLDSQNAQLEAAKAQYEAGITALNQQIADLQNSASAAEDSSDEAEAGNEDASPNENAKQNEDTAAAASQLERLNEQISSLQNEYSSFLSGTYEPGLAEIETARASLEQKSSGLANSQTALEQKEAQLTQAKAQLDAGKEELSQAKAQLDSGNKQLAQAKTQLDEGREQLSRAKVQLDEGNQKLTSAKKQLENAQNQISQAEKQISASKKQAAEGQSQLSEAAETIAEKEALLNEKVSEYQAGVSSLESGKSQLADKTKELEEAQKTLETEKSDGEQKIEDALEEIQSKEKEYQNSLAEYNDKKPDAEKDIADAEDKLTDARETVASLKAPVYALDTRREIPGSEGYTIYGSVSDIIDSLANVFPVFLYLVAALVTLTTMTRFVDEERMNSGTLKALGYEDRDIIKKFAVYGAAASLLGAVAGILAGHILLPKIVYNAYGKSFTLPEIELHFYPGITIAALLLAFASAVLPAVVVAYRELRQKPAALLLPKAPASGSRILLEYIRPLWNHLSFTHKVTARNIFRYKKRMLMTIFGVCGAVTLLFAGFSVQHSISGINDRQYGELLKYDLIVAQNDNLNEDEQAEIKALLNKNEVAQYTPVYYESLTKVAGDKQDKQSITMIVPENTNDIGDYIELTNRKSGEKLSLSADGAVISERIAKLTGISAGDTISITGSDDTEYEVTISGITEMYTGHFLFMSPEYYETVFGTDYHTNANLVTLTDHSIKNANEQANAFMALDGVKGVVQNTTLINQINTIVKSLNKIMDILILVAVLLGVVILYNLTNINVSERIRELSTIKVLGFYDKEVTLYIYRETILLTVIGVFAGFGLGDLLYLYILDVVPPDNVMFNPALGAKAFWLPALIIALITLILGIHINHRLKNVDMLEALKSVD